MKQIRQPIGHLVTEGPHLVQSKVLVARQSATRAIDTPIEIKRSFKTPMQQSFATQQWWRVLDIYFLVQLRMAMENPHVQ